MQGAQPHFANKAGCKIPEQSLTWPGLEGTDWVLAKFCQESQLEGISMGRWNIKMIEIFTT